MNDEAMPDDRTALLVAARVLEAIRPYCLLELTTRYPVSHDGRCLGAFTIDEALDLADAALAGREARR
ncbi:hypothetical protein [Pleomorphomonas carboxyditropha]|uniref:Uncharacterized protein n=1 Tax=Pleomorphomonas carboxyditropha TaxID=2023338 RepID=A0A2G9WQH8_9HYPH|nr:hypothetical protein [Pleomorphomonas carboxyditropha]PIO96979.1 hypothetical protein CJ014_22860 [Pleomorphomonas carboxyditropha]